MADYFGRPKEKAPPSSADGQGSPDIPAWAAISILVGGSVRRASDDASRMTRSHAGSTAAALVICAVSPARHAMLMRATSPSSRRRRRRRPPRILRC